MEMDTLEEWRGMTYEKLFGGVLNKSDEELEQFLSRSNLLPSSRTCICNSEMRLANKREDKKKWVCKNKTKCGKELSFFTDTFFANARLSIKEIIKLSYFWCRENVKYNEIQFQFQRDDNSTISANTIADWLQFFRDVCTEYYIRNPKMLGGEGKIVEIDETCISRRKYNKGRLVSEQVWIFGGVERGDSNNIFVEIVQNRTAETLLPIIQNRIAPGTTIMSDLWRSYFHVGQLPEGYQHLTVNHSLNFVDPDSGAHTQTIESSWQKLKRPHKDRFGTHRQHLQDYIEEHVWRKEFGGPDVMFNLWNQIREHYSAFL